MAGGSVDDFSDYDDKYDDSYQKNKKPKKGKEFWGGSKKNRDKWYGIKDKDFQKCWEREGKRTWGGDDIQEPNMAKEIYEYWKEIGSPKSNGGE